MHLQAYFSTRFFFSIVYFSYSYLKVKRCTFWFLSSWCSRPRDAFDNRRLQLQEAGQETGRFLPLNRFCWLLRAQPALLLSSSCLHLQARAAQELIYCHQCCCCTGTGVPRPLASFASSECVSGPDCLPQAPSHPDQVWSQLPVASSGGQEKVFGFLFLFAVQPSFSKDAKLSSNIVQDGCEKGVLNQGTASKLQLLKYQSVFKDSKHPLFPS